MKPIKFDLPLNGTRIATLDQLKEKLTPEILESFRSGKLAKWLRVRSLNEQAKAIESLLAADSEREVQLFKSLCEVFVSEIDENDAREAVREYKTSMPPMDNTIEEPEHEYSKEQSDNIDIEPLELHDSWTAGVKTFIDTLTAEPSGVSHSETENPSKEKYRIKQTLLKRIGRENNFFITDSIPKKKLDNALKSYGENVDEDEEELLVLYDDTLFGHAKDGFLLTNRKIYCSGSNYVRKLKKTSISLDKIYEVYGDGGSPSTLKINGQDIYDGTYSGEAMKIFVEFLKDYLAL